MADTPLTVGFLTVQAALRQALADSSDEGDQPDALPAYANVLIRPVGIPPTRPFLVAGSPPAIYPVAPVVCRVVDGVLYGPADGSAPTVEETPAQPVRIIDPYSPGIDFTGWAWQADFTPINGGTWAAFSITFNAATEEDGTTVNLANAALLETNVNAAPQPITWVVAGDGTNPPEIPAGAQPGHFLLDSTTWDLYQIGA